MEHVEQAVKEKVDEDQGNEGDDEHEFHKEVDEWVGVDDNFFDEDYANLVGDNEFDRYERPSSPIDPSTYIAPSIHIVQTTAYDQSNINPYEQNTSNWVPTYFSDDEHNIKSGKNDYGHSDILCIPIHSEDDEKHLKYIEFRAEVDMPNPVFEKGMLFSDHKEFKRVVQSYRIKHKYPLLIVKNESRKVSYKCENCESYIYVS